MERIGSHHAAGKDSSIEAILLSDADIIDIMGTIGVAREFSRYPKNLRAAYDLARERMISCPVRVILEQTKPVVEARLQSMQRLLDDFLKETNNLF